MIPSSDKRAEEEDKKIITGKKVAYLGIFLSLAIILSYVEALIPFPFPIPGMKLGLANLSVVTAMYYFGEKEAFAVSLLRIIIIGVMFGTGYSLIYSLCGGLLSFGVMAIIKRLSFGVIPVSLSGGIAHNTGQIGAAAVLLGTGYIAYYLPVLLIAGAVTGGVIGLLAGIVIKRVKI